MSIDTNEVVQAYLSVRDARDAAKAQYEQIDEALKTDMNQLEQVLLEVCNQTNANSINTDLGTVIRSLAERAYCNDWDAFRKWEAEHPDYDLREKRIHQSNYRTYVEQNPEAGLLPGINVMREFKIQVRRSSK